MRTGRFGFATRVNFPALENPPEAPPAPRVHRAIPYKDFPEVEYVGAIEQVG